MGLINIPPCPSGEWFPRKDSEFSERGKDSVGAYRQCSAGPWCTSQRPRLPSLPDTCTERVRSARRTHSSGRERLQEGTTGSSQPYPGPLGTSDMAHLCHTRYCDACCPWGLKGKCHGKKKSAYLDSTVDTYCLVPCFKHWSVSPQEMLVFSY